MKIQIAFFLAVCALNTSSHLLGATTKTREHATCASAPSAGTFPINHLGIASPTALETLSGTMKTSKILQETVHT